MEGRHRVGVLAELPQALRELGADPQAILARAGVEAALLRDQENAITFTAIGRLLAEAVATTGCAHIGLLVGQRGSLARLGRVGRLMRSASTLGEALLDLCTNQVRYTRGGVTYLTNHDGGAFWGYAVHLPWIEAFEQLVDGAAAVAYRLLHELAGARPEQVWLCRAPPADPVPYRAAFGTLPRFNMDCCGLVLPRETLTLPVSTADPVLRQILRAKMEAYRAREQPAVAEHVRRILCVRVLAGGATLTQVAADLRLTARTLNRKLEVEGATFRSLLALARHDAACQLLSATPMPVTDIALGLGYAAPSGFTRAFADWTGTTPTAWRATSRDSFRRLG